MGEVRLAKCVSSVDLLFDLASRLTVRNRLFETSVIDKMSTNVPRELKISSIQ